MLHIMKKSLSFALLLLGAMAAFGQSLVNLDFTSLAAFKGNDVITEKVPVQIAIMPNDVYFGDQGEDLRMRVETLIGQMEQNLEASMMKDFLKNMDEELANMKKQRDEVKNDPALRAMLDQSIELAKEKMADLKQQNTTPTPYTYSPASVTKDVLALALNHRFYSAAELLDNDNWVVCVGDRLNDDPDNLQQDWYFRYGVIDPQGKTLIPFNYHFVGFLTERDLYFVRKKVGDKVCGGAIDSHGNVRIPFDYKSVRVLDGEHNLLAIEGHNERYGIMNTDGKVLLPAEYVGYRATIDGFVFYKDDKSFFVDYNGKAKEME